MAWEISDTGRHWKFPCLPPTRIDFVVYPQFAQNTDGCTLPQQRNQDFLHKPGKTARSGVEIFPQSSSCWKHKQLTWLKTIPEAPSSLSCEKTKPESKRCWDKWWECGPCLLALRQMGPIMAFEIHEKHNMSCAQGWKCSQKIPLPGADPSTPLPSPTCICWGGVILERSGIEMYRIVAKTPFFLTKLCCKEIKIACWGEQTNCGGIPKISCVKGKVWMHVLEKECVAYALLCFHYTAICWLLGSINNFSYLY